MADYSLLIARAVSRLESNTSEARQQLYERARTALIAQLTKDSAVSELEIALEQSALEAAIFELEQKSSAEHFCQPTLQSRENQRLNHRGSTTLLIFSILFFPVLWVIEPICMSVYWVARLPVPDTARSRLKPWPEPPFSRGQSRRLGRLARIESFSKPVPIAPVTQPVTKPDMPLRAVYPIGSTSRLARRLAAALRRRELMFDNQSWRVFGAGFLCGIIILAAVWLLSLWNSIPQRSADDNFIYDKCLAGNRSVVACDAMMRMIDRQRIIDRQRTLKQTLPTADELLDPFPERPARP
jgi:hypothetical protein